MFHLPFFPQLEVVSRKPMIATNKDKRVWLVYRPIHRNIIIVIITLWP
jgi:hypothetical protein